MYVVFMHSPRQIYPFVTRSLHRLLDKPLVEALYISIMIILVESKFERHVTMLI